MRNVVLFCPRWRFFGLLLLRSYPTGGELGFGKCHQHAHALLPIANTGGEGADLGAVQASLEGIAVAGLSAGFAL